METIAEYAAAPWEKMIAVMIEKDEARRYDVLREAETGIIAAVSASVKHGKQGSWGTLKVRGEPSITFKDLLLERHQQDPCTPT